MFSSLYYKPNRVILLYWFIYWLYWFSPRKWWCGKIFVTSQVISSPHKICSPRIHVAEWGESLSVCLLCSVYVCLCVSYVWRMSVSRLLPGRSHCSNSCSVSPLRDTTAIGVWGSATLQLQLYPSLSGDIYNAGQSLTKFDIRKKRIDLVKICYKT